MLELEIFQIYTKLSFMFCKKFIENQTLWFQASRSLVELQKYLLFLFFYGKNCKNTFHYQHEG